MRRVFTRRGDDVVAKLSVEDKALLVQIPDLLATVGVIPDDAAISVLYRNAYRDDPDASAEFQELVGSQLATDRDADLDVLMELTRATQTISVDEAKSVLRAINAARLTLAARANAFDTGSGWETRISQDPALAAVAWLGGLQSDLIDALSG